MAPTPNGTSTTEPSTTHIQAPSLHDDYPWIQSPLIVSAPMGGFATAPLASAVSLHGGIGLIGAVADMTALEKELQIARRTFIDAGVMRDETEAMPLGVGFLPFVLEMSKAVEVVRKYKPRIVWLSFAREMCDFATWAEAMREASPQTKIWIMLGRVSAALEVVVRAKPDVLVMQGADAGGHGFERSAGIVSIVPETIDALEAAGYGHVPVLAAGGVVDGRGVAAALSLGAKGVIMGTRFLASHECLVPHPVYREVILKAKDGGEATVRAKVFDELRGPNIWPEAYDGRAIRNMSWQDEANGAEVKEIQERYAEAAKGEDGGYAPNGEGAKGRTMVWAGAGVGLVNKMQNAADILVEVRKGAKKALEVARSNL
jgi:nitronate monooxygenase